MKPLRKHLIQTHTHTYAHTHTHSIFMLSNSLYWQVDIPDSYSRHSKIWDFVSDFMGSPLAQYLHANIIVLYF